MADTLISDLIKRYRYGDSHEDFVETNHRELDLLIVHEEEFPLEQVLLYPTSI